MTKKMLLRRLWVVGIIFVAMIITGIIIHIYSDTRTFGAYKDLMPVAISILAVYLANAFQQRSMFIQALRGLWSDMIEAKIELIAYTSASAPHPDDYAKAFRSISSVIDKMRGVYRNVGEDEEYIGYFPYQPLHDMREELERLGLGGTKEERARAYRGIIQAWEALRYKFLVEFETPEPTNPITVKNSRSAQKQGVSPSRGGVPADAEVADEMI